VLRRGETVTFEMTLFGRAVNGLPYIVFSIEEMANRGLGVRRGQFALQEVYCLGRSGECISLDYQAEGRQFDLLKSQVVYGDEYLVDRLAGIQSSTRIKLRFLTRVRIRVQGSVQADLDFSTLIRFLWRRTSLMMALQGEEFETVDQSKMLGRADKVRTLASAMVKHEVWRGSNRQQKWIHHDGYLGEMVFEGDGLEYFLPLLAIGELLHLGSGATFGLGKYEIVS
jgi:hypothetical protein